MNSIHAIFNTILAGIDIADEEKNSLIGLYYISYYKTVIELLVGMKGQQAEFHQKLNEFITASIASFAPDEEQQFSEVMNQQMKKNLHDIITIFSDNLTPELKEKVQNNLSTTSI